MIDVMIIIENSFSRFSMTKSQGCDSTSCKSSFNVFSDIHIDIIMRGSTFLFGVSNAYKN